MVRLLLRLLMLLVTAALTLRSVGGKDLPHFSELLIEQKQKQVSRTRQHAHTHPEILA